MNANHTDLAAKLASLIDGSLPQHERAALLEQLDRDDELRAAYSDAIAIGSLHANDSQGRVYGSNKGNTSAWRRHLRTIGWTAAALAAAAVFMVVRDRNAATPQLTRSIVLAAQSAPVAPDWTPIGGYALRGGSPVDNSAMLDMAAARIGMWLVALDHARTADEREMLRQSIVTELDALPGMVALAASLRGAAISPDSMSVLLAQALPDKSIALGACGEFALLAENAASVAPSCTPLSSETGHAASLGELAGSIRQYLASPGEPARAELIAARAALVR